jgi:hypothetical protein
LLFVLVSVNVASAHDVVEEGTPEVVVQAAPQYVAPYGPYVDPYCAPAPYVVRRGLLLRPVVVAPAYPAYSAYPVYPRYMYRGWYRGCWW